MATFVLVHGAWGGGWQWTFVARELRMAGHVPYAPSLTSLGDRSHLAGPSVGLETHIQDIVNLMHFEDLTAVTLVGWSYGTTVVTGVASRCPERLAHVVYLDGHAPEDGQAVAGFYAPEERAVREERARQFGGGWNLPLAATEEDFRTTIPDDGLRQWFFVREVPHPLRAFTDPIRLPNPIPAFLPRTLIACTLQHVQDSPVASLARRVHDDPAWRYRELEASHFAPLTAPREVARILMDAAG